MKKLRYIVLIIMVIIGMKNISAYTYDNTLKVYDYAGVLTDEEETKLKEYIDNYIMYYNLDLALVTVKYYNYDSLKKYMTEFYNTYNFGIGKDKSGVISVIDLKNNDIGILTFGKAKMLYSNIEIKNALIDSKNETNYYNKARTIINSFDIYGRENNTYKEIIQSINWIIIILASLIISSLLIAIEIFKVKKVKISSLENTYVRKDSLIINKKEDEILTTHTKQVNK